MTFRKLFVVGAAMAALGFAGAALAQTSAQKAQIDQAKAAGVVGEQADGYLGFRTSTSDAGLRLSFQEKTAIRRDWGSANLF